MQGDNAALAFVPRPAAPPSKPLPGKMLSLGTQPSAPAGETCDVREILAAAAQEQDAEFNAMSATVRNEHGPTVREAIETLDALHRSFGKDER